MSPDPPRVCEAANLLHLNTSPPPFRKIAAQPLVQCQISTPRISAACENIPHRVKFELKESMQYSPPKYCTSEDTTNRRV